MCIFDDQDEQSSEDIRFSSEDNFFSYGQKNALFLSILGNTDLRFANLICFITFAIR